jgi:hypothetical protein
MRRYFLAATFADADRLVDAVRVLRRERFRIYDVYSPYPIHGLDEAMGIRRTKLPRITLLAALGGLAVAIAFQFYAAVLDWPMNVGGKPDNSTLAFVPISFELMVLFAGLSSVAAFFLRARLFPGKRPRLAAQGVTDDVFALVLRQREDLDMERARQALQFCGASAVEEMAADL